jgi:hypothetical protein
VVRKGTSKHGQTWTKDDVKRLRQLVRGNTPTGLIAMDLGRTRGAVYQKAHEVGVSLKPVNRSPYNRRKKR